ncbi:MAG: hypothetical protein KAW02_03135 [candidate division Zixibacteria bacterium]|nr:hypothetical protein [candidate division Zixibacteria bacterium]
MESLISDVLNVIKVSATIIMIFSGMSRKILLDRGVVWSVPPKAGHLAFGQAEVEDPALAGLDTPDTYRTLKLEVRLGL